MFSLHIDTERGWRGGQSLVLHTVVGLRALGHRAGLVAHPDGELRRRMSEGHDLIPLAPHGEVDLSAAWRLSRLVKRLMPNVIHAYDPHAVAMASTALSIAPPSPKPALVTSVRTVSHLAHSSFARWKYSQIDCFIANSVPVHNRLIADGVPEAKTAIVNQGVDVERIVRMPATKSTPPSICQRTRRSSATWPLSCRRRDTTTSSMRQRSLSARCRTRDS